MRLRTYLSLAALASLVAAAIVLPGTPAVRGAVVDRLVVEAAEAGFDVRVDATAGNLWRGVTLRGVGVTGPGLDARAGTIRLHYFLPPLLTGELPLGVRVDDLDGSVDLEILTDALAAPTTAAPPTVRIRLQDVTMAHSRVAVAGIPFTLPDLRVEGMRVTTDGDVVSAAVDLVTAEGHADLVARTRLGSGLVEIDVVSADATIGRHWWAGIRGGTLQGVVRVQNATVSGDLRVEGGSLVALGADVDAISGPITWRGTDVRAALSGSTLGGTLRATAHVDALARHWTALGSADAALDAVVAALWDLGAPGAPVASAGTVRADIRAEGWTLAHVEVDARAEGTLVGEPLDDFGARVVWDSLAGFTVDADGGWGGGSARARVRSVGGVSDVDASVREATWAGIALDEVDAAFRLGAEGRGSARMIGSWDGPLGLLALESDLTLDADGAALYLRGDGNDLAFEGAVVAPGLYGDAELDGGVRVRTPGSWWRGGVAPPVSLDLQGTLATPRVEGVIGGDLPVAPTLPGFDLAVDLRGSVTIALAEGGVDVDGALGDAAIAGGWGAGRSVRIAADRIAVADPVTLDVTDVVVTLAPDPSGWRLEAAAGVGAIETGLAGMTLGTAPLGSVTLTGDGSGFDLRDERGSLSVVLEDGTVRADLDDLALVLGGTALAARGEATRAADGIWLGDVRLIGSGIDGRIALEGTEAVADLSIDAGTVLGAWRTGVDMVATLAIDPAGIAAEARAGELDATLRARLGDDGAVWEASLRHRDDRIDAAGAPGDWSATGALPLAPLLRVGGAPDVGEGRVTLDLAGGTDDATGTARLTFRDTLALDADLEFDVLIAAGRADVRARGTLLGEDVWADGLLWPDVDAAVSWGPVGPVRLAADTATGSGTLPALTLAGVRIPEQAWSLDVDVDAARATVRLGASEATIAWGAAPLAASARLDQPLLLLGEEARVHGEVAWALDREAGSIDLTLDAPGLAFSGSVVGDLDEALVRAAGSPQALGEALVIPLDLDGDVRLDGVVSVRTPSAGLQASWQAEGGRLDALVEADGGGWSAELTGPGLSARATAGEWSVRADAFDPGAWLSLPGIEATLDGRLSRASGSWSGVLTVETSSALPIGVEARGLGDTLGIEAHARGSWYEASLVGTWGDAPRFEIEATAHDAGGSTDARVDARGVVARTGGAWQGRGALTAMEGGVGPLTWSALAADWVWEAGALRFGGASGLAGVMTLSADGLAGALQTTVALGGVPHALRVESTAEVALTLTGESVRLAARSAGGRWTLEGSVDDLADWEAEGAPLLPWASALGRIDLRAHAAPGAGGWSWEFDAASSFTQGAPSWPLSLAARGVSDTGTGSLALGPDAAPALRVGLDWQGDVVAATLRGEEIAADEIGRLLGAPLSGDLAGGATLRLGGAGSSLRADLRGALAYDDRPFTLELTSSEGAAWSLRAGTLDGAWSGSISAPDTDALARGGATVALSGPDTALRGRAVMDGDAFQLRLGGSAAGRTVSLSAAGDPRTATGSATWGASRLDVDLGTERLAARAHVARSDAPAGPWAIALDLDRSDAWRVDRLRVDAAGADARLELHGASFPVDLEGTLAWSDLERNVRVHGGDGSPWRLDLDALTITAGPDGRLRGAGAARVDLAGVRFDLDLGTLSWAADAGWAGDGSLRVDIPALGSVAEVALRAAAAAAEAPSEPSPLRVEAGARRGGDTVGSASLEIPGDLVGALTGALEVDLSSAEDAAAAWRFRVAGPIGGTVAAPTIDADLSVSGAVPARGRLRLDAGGLRADLVGEGLSASARLDGAGWRAQASLADADVSTLLPWLETPRVDVALDARSGDGGVEVMLDTVRLRAPGTNVVGHGRLAPSGELRVTFRSDVDLADLRIGTDLEGRVDGPLTLRYDLGTPWTDADVTGMLGVTEARAEGVPGIYSGDVQVAGPTADPRLLATLQAHGDATGTIRADVRPRRGTGRLDADLQAHALQVTIRAALDEAGITADGRLAQGGSAVELTSDAGAVLLRGEGALAPWSGRLQASPWSLDLRGDLSALTPLAQGVADVTLAWPDGEGPWPTAEGSWRGARLGPLGVPDATIRTEGDGSWSASGEGLEARLELPTLAWSVDLADAPLALDGASLALSISAAGGPGDARATTSLDGLWQGERVEVAVHAEAGANGRIALRGEGTLLGGRVHLDATRDDGGGWSGEAALQDAAQGGEPLDASLRISGAGALPEGEADVRWGANALAARATYREGAVALTLTGRVGADALEAEGTLWPELDLTIVSASPPGRPESGGTESLHVRGSWTGDEPLRVDGSLSTDVQGVRLGVLAGEGGAARITVRHPALPDVALATLLPRAPVADVIALLGREGVTLEVDGDGSGRISLERDDGIWSARLEAVALPVAGGMLRADGHISPGAGRVDVRLDPPAHLGGVVLVGLPSTVPILGRLTLEGSRARFTTEAPWSSVTELDLDSGLLRLDADVGWDGPDGRSLIAGRLEVDGASGVRGDLALSGVHVSSPDASVGLRVDGTLRGTGSGLRVDATARARRSSITLTGTVPLAPLAPALGVPDEGRPLDLRARVAALDLEDVPWLADVAPGVSGIVSGSAVVRGAQLIGQLVSEDFALAGTELPATLTLAGDGDGIDARLELGGRREAIFTGSWRDGTADLLARLERFPVHTVVESIVGRSDVTALVTGVARAGWDPSRLDAFDLRLATEDIRLERAGVVTTGTVTFELADGALVIREASFAGSGTWSARGEIRPDRLDLELIAVDADFGPLLGLIPAFARYGVAAEGDLEIVGRGTLADPDLRLRSGGLRVSVAGTSYELSEAALDLVGEALRVDAAVRGVAPLGGEVRVQGDGVVRLQPFTLERADVRAVGDLDVPVIGRIDEVDAEIRARAGTAPTLRLDGRIGAPFHIEGTLAPFDVRGVGRGLQVGVPDIFVASATIDADLRARVDDGFVLGGRIDVAQARLDLAARAAAREGEQPSEATARDDASRRAALQLLRFDGVRITAPQRVTLSETIGTAEASIDLTLTGDAADLMLDGTVSALRGTFRFSGQDLELTRGVARFEPARGILPVLEIEARARFEKARVAPGSDIRFAAPSGPRFDVVLRFEAEVSTSGPGGAVSVDLVPQLTSDALIEVASGADGLSAGTRALSELELLSLIALGRIEIGGGTEALASTFAQRALDTAVDLLVVAELQAALSEALGLDVVEIRTTALSDLFDGRADPFGVSLRFGGYLSDELFASYRVGTFDDAEREFAVTNELAFTYELGPVAFDLAGRIDFPSIATQAPVPSLAASVRYDVSRSFAFEAGLDVGSASQTARFGVTIRW